MTAQLGCYHDVLTYDQVADLPQTETIYVDVAGDLEPAAAVHRRLASRLEHSLVVGATHWDHEATATPSWSVRRRHFFAPTQITKRVSDWVKPSSTDASVGRGRSFTAWTDEWLQLEHSSGRTPSKRHSTSGDGRAIPAGTHGDTGQRALTPRVHQRGRHG